MVNSKNGQPIAGVSVKEVGGKNASSTNENGDFTLSVSNNKVVLSVQYVGYMTKSVEGIVGTPLRVELQEDNTILDEVVVVAYGEAKKKDLTGSVSTIDNRALNMQSNSTVSRALEGAAPGIQVSAVDGQPGIDMGIRVRGIGSASQNTSNALVVIDGVPAQNDNPLATLNPKDIQSISVLKDAASTALYGARGANGVVLVTTKKGMSGKTRISFEGKLGVNQVGPYQFDKISDPKDIYEFAWLSIYNSARYGVDGTGISKDIPPMCRIPICHMNRPPNLRVLTCLIISVQLLNFSGTA
ncbi:TonB-dependent receptor plug domain-containing protein [Sphingobacterium sp. E70]|uniref:TonB-dependent receptor plug domain-containing protein n=1 Tax=Sphingobacterium sp. E70 TaxID=2853439 RepID=UPI00211BB18D|nr:TonB-dependent receptor plug domain-containing protein [Sphingobacterium sp. E70]ULT22284.1 TonB-dependent receptor plug domain-containing protein [Sphingobacterium sp. E70]